jgi:hypothetical protein
MCSTAAPTSLWPISRIANTPTWDNLIEGQINLSGAVRRTHRVVTNACQQGGVIMVQHPALTDDRDLGDGESDSVVLAQFVWRVSIKLKTRTSSLGSEPVGANHDPGNRVRT